MVTGPWSDWSTSSDGWPQLKPKFSAVLFNIEYLVVMMYVGKMYFLSLIIKISNKFIIKISIKFEINLCDAGLTLSGYLSLTWHQMMAHISKFRWYWFWLCFSDDTEVRKTYFLPFSIFWGYTFYFIKRETGGSGLGLSLRYFEKFFDIAKHEFQNPTTLHKCGVMKLNWMKKWLN